VSEDATLLPAAATELEVLPRRARALSVVLP
jgi:hypothetical protein